MIIRPRRLRRSPAIRQMVRETTLSVKDFINPLFVRHGQNIKDPIVSMPGQYHFSVDKIGKEVEERWSLGIPSINLFGFHKNFKSFMNLMKMNINQKFLLLQL